MIYKHIHKPHHKWISEWSFPCLPTLTIVMLTRVDNFLVPTPFASHAFHPVDGYAQSIPYHLFIFLFPLYRPLYLCLFVVVNVWAIFVSDA